MAPKVLSNLCFSNFSSFLVFFFNLKQFPIHSWSILETKIGCPRYQGFDPQPHYMSNAMEYPAVVVVVVVVVVVDDDESLLFNFIS